MWRNKGIGATFSAVLLISQKVAQWIPPSVQFSVGRVPVYNQPNQHQQTGSFSPMHTGHLSFKGSHGFGTFSPLT